MLVDMEKAKKFKNLANLSVIDSPKYTEALLENQMNMDLNY